MFLLFFDYQGGFTLEMTVKGFSSCGFLASVCNNIYTDINDQGKLENSSKQARKKKSNRKRCYIMYRYMNRAAFVSATVQSDLHYLTLFSVFKCLTEPEEAQHVRFFRYLLVPMFRCLQDTEAVG